MLIKNEIQIKPLPLYIYLSILLALILTGIGVSLYLSISHYRVYTDMDYASFCAISKAINCDTVSQSSYSVIWGIPVPIWGIIGYFFLLATLVFALDRKTGTLHMLPVFIGIGIIFSLISLTLGLIAVVYIKAYCIMCIVTYGVNFMVLFMVWLIRQRFDKKPWSKSLSENIAFLQRNKIRLLKFYTPIIAIIVISQLTIPNYWYFNIAEPENAEIATGVTQKGEPWIGASKPMLTIIEYSDYMCFQCKKMHFFLRNLISIHPEKIRLVHRHFPMDIKANPLLKTNLHPGSSILSAVAIHSAKKNRFWKVNDILYNYNTDRGAIYLDEIAKATGLLLQPLKTGIHKPYIRQKLHQDIISGLKLGITGTPSYLINGKVYSGQIPPKILDIIR